MEFTEDIKEACRIMNEGGVILYPTDTIWGIGCDATNPEAVHKVYEIKKRIDSKALIVLVDSSVKVDFYVSDVPQVAWTELHNGQESPITLKVFETEKIEKAHSDVPGTIKTDGKTYLHVAAGNGYLSIKSLQLAGKKRLGIDEFLRGFKVLDGMKLL